MATKGSQIRYHIISTLWIALMGIPTGYVVCESCRSNLSSFINISIYSAILWVVLWKGNEAVTNVIDKKWNWVKFPIQRLASGIAGHIIYTVVAILAINYTIFMLLGWDQQLKGLKNIIELSLPPVIITIIISTILTAREFFLSWRQSAVNEEIIKKELAITRYEALKNQVNPHFLFNSLNVLTSLVYKDADLSAKFIKKLSEVYRYVLEVKDIQLVDLDQEIDFLNSYIFLLKMRHQQGLNVEIALPQENQFMVIPLALQMLVENAVKHNTISIEEPLNIQITCEGDYLIVSNNLQKRPVKKTASSEIGVSNIKARYAFLTDSEVSVIENQSDYVVKLPLLSMKDNKV